MPKSFHVGRVIMRLHQVEKTDYSEYIFIQSIFLRKEKRIAVRVLGDLFAKVLVRIKVLPDTRREDVLVPLVPSPIDDFRHVRIVLEPFQLFYGERVLLGIVVASNAIAIVVLL